MPIMPSLLEMLKAGAHFGHRQSKWHPKMEPYIFTVRSGVHIINLEKTAEELAKALEFVKKTVAGGGKVLFIGTKKQAQPIVKKYAVAAETPYVIGRWMGGTLTNFSIIIKLVKKLKEMRRQQETGEWAKYTKKEQVGLKKEFDKLETMVGGLELLDKKPDALFIIDVKKEKTAVAEATKTGVPIVALCDTNVNPQGISYVIPANDDATKTIELITRLLAEAVKEGRSESQEHENTKTLKQNEEKKEESAEIVDKI